MSQYVRHKPLDPSVLAINEKFRSFERAWRGYCSWRETMVHGRDKLSETENMLLNDILKSFNAFIEVIALRATLKNFGILEGLKRQGKSSSHLLKAEGLELRLQGDTLVEFVKKSMERPRPGIGDFFDIAWKEVDPQNGRPQGLRSFLNRGSECVPRTGLGMDVQVPKPVIEDTGRWWEVPANIVAFKRMKDGFEKVLGEMLRELGWREVSIREV